MTIETATYIASLNSSYPADTDKVYEGDNHIRLLKSTILASLPNISGTMSATHTELNFLDGVSAGTVVASKALVCGSSKELDVLTVGSLTASTATVLNGTVSGTAIKDEDDMSSDSASHLSTQQAIKAYTDNTVGNTVNDFLVFEDRKTSGTNGGTGTATTWNTRAISALINNGITGASLASNQITLPAGTYYLEVSAPCYEVNSHVIRAYNATDTAVVTDTNANDVIGTMEHSDQSVGAGTQTRSVIRTVFTLAAEKAIEFQHYIERSDSTRDLGVAAGIAGVEEIYLSGYIRKLP